MNQPAPSTSAATATSAPRAEFRVFGIGVIDAVQARMWSAGAVLHSTRVMKPETYVLSRHADDANVKLRDGLLDIKAKTLVTPEGYEVYAPLGKFSFPLDAKARALLSQCLRVKDVSREDTLDEAALICRAGTHPDLAVARVEKTRYGFSVDGVICEYAIVLVNGERVETACCETTDTAMLARVIGKLGLKAWSNTSYVAALQRMVGFPREPNRNEPKETMSCPK